MTDEARGDSWNLHEPCEQCIEHLDHIEQLEQALAAAKAAMILQRARMAAMMDALHFAGWGVA
jgi:hypothetical protein